MTDYPHCTLDGVLANYGSPSSSAVISGSLKEPKELLLFYDLGISKNKEVGEVSSVLPISPEQLPSTFCRTSTVMNIVAHEDDDLLFLSPDLIRSIDAGDCVRTIYVTAGDAGSDEFYWLGRQQGAQAAYSEMTGSREGWIQHIVKMTDEGYATVYNLRGNSKISLIFMHLPDGNINGGGFRASSFENLQKLMNDQINLVSSVDKESRYTKHDLKVAMAELIQIYDPETIRTQSQFTGKAYRDHSDHMAVGSLVSSSLERYRASNPTAKPVSVQYYLGYPSRELYDKISEVELVKKEAAFYAYAKFDKSVCGSRDLCTGSVYGHYLAKQHQHPY